MKQETFFAETAGEVTYRIRQADVPLAPLERLVSWCPRAYSLSADNRDDSSDSRHWGAVSGSSIIGQVVAGD